MKTINVTFFKTSGKYYTTETTQVKEGIDFYDMLDILRDWHRLKDMHMVIEDSGDGKEPYIVPHFFSSKGV